MLTRQIMMRNAQYFLAISCLIALGVIVYRFSRIEESVLTPKVKIYSFNLGDNAVKIHEDGLDVANIEWTKNPTSGDSLQGFISKIINNSKVVHTNSPSKTKIISSEVTKITKYLTRHKSTQAASVQHKTTEKPVVTTATANKVTAAAASKSTTPRVMVKSVGNLPLCSKEGENLVGPLAVDQSVPETEDNIDDVWQSKGWVEKGGAWRPTKCQAVSKVAIVIPYRKREQQLKIFLRHMHPFLKRQLLDYRILVIEQAEETPFNRAMLFNIGYKEALKFHDFQCFIFHDVDLIPENDRNYYGCPSAPRHLSVAIDKFNYRLPYKAIFGGAGAFRKDDFEKINGFSNKFWGWGGEDDDLYNRITAKGFKLTRPSMTVGRYKMVRIFHKSAKADPMRFDKLRSSRQRMDSDGINSLKYKVQQTVENALYTKVTVVVNPKEV